MKAKSATGTLICLLAAAFAPAQALNAQAPALSRAERQPSAPRRPRGIYAVINVQENIKKEKATDSSVTAPQVRAYFKALDQQLLANRAVSGLAIWINWDVLNPRPLTDPKPYDWTYLDDAFAEVFAWNAAHSASTPKSIQLIPLPGFQTPKWVLDQIPSCDALFETPEKVPAKDCGKATFAGFVEGKGVRELPMPWNALYKASWRTFLTALAGRYGSNPAFVSVSVAGPTASSEEMILPDNANTPAQEKFGGLRPNMMWHKLLTFHYPDRAKYHGTDQAFIDEWEAAITSYGEIFNGVTLIATTGNGLPNLAVRGFAVPAEFSAACPIPNMDCAAEMTIVAYFGQQNVGGANAKAVQEDGMEAARVGAFNLGVPGIKVVSQATAHLSVPAGQILGGAQFNSSFSNFTLTEGCTAKFPPKPKDQPAACTIPPGCAIQACIPVDCIPPPCLAPGVTPQELSSFGTLGRVPRRDLLSPEQAVYNVLHVYFDSTLGASAFGGTSGGAPMNYLQIYATDFQYAESNVHDSTVVLEVGGGRASTSAEALLTAASDQLLAFAEPSGPATIRPRLPRPVSGVGHPQ